jgi:hypothetical protein
LRGVISGLSNFRVRVRVKVIKCVVIIEKKEKKSVLGSNSLVQ